MNDFEVSETAARQKNESGKLHYMSGFSLKPSEAAEHPVLTAYADAADKYAGQKGKGRRLLAEGRNSEFRDYVLPVIAGMAKAYAAGALVPAAKPKEK